MNKTLKIALICCVFLWDIKGVSGNYYNVNGKYKTVPRTLYLEIIYLYFLAEITLMCVMMQENSIGMAMDRHS